MAGLAASFGSGAMTNSVSDLEQADTIFIIGSNTATSHPLVATRIFRARQNGAKIVVADPRKNQIAAFAETYVQHKPGTDVALLNGMMKVILDQGLENKAFIKDKTEEFDAFKTLIGTMDLDEISTLTGVSVEDITTLALTYATSDKSAIVYCMGITQHTNVTKAASKRTPRPARRSIFGVCNEG